MQIGIGGRPYAGFVAKEAASGIRGYIRRRAYSTAQIEEERRRLLKLKEARQKALLAAKAKSAARLETLAENLIAFTETVEEWRSIDMSAIEFSMMDVERILDQRDRYDELLTAKTVFKDLASDLARHIERVEDNIVEMERQNRNQNAIAALLMAY